MKASFLSLRKAEAPDVAGAASIMLAAFEGLENARLGAGYARAYLASFLGSETRSLLVAEDGGRILGFAAAEHSDFRAQRYLQLRPAAAWAFMRRPWIALRPDVLSMAARRLSMSAEPALPPSWFLSLIGVDPQAQGRGVGRALLQAFEEEGRSRHFDRAMLFVRDDNAPARALYERAGWQQRGSTERGRTTYEIPLADEALQPIARAR